MAVAGRDGFCRRHLLLTDRAYDYRIHLLNGDCQDEISDNCEWVIS